MNVLVAETDSLHAGSMKARIDSMGHRADIVPSEKEALAAVSARPYGVAFVDLQLGDADGCDLIRLLQNLCPRLAIVAMTLTNSRELERKARALGVIYYMIKPVDERHTEDIVQFLSEKT